MAYNVEQPDGDYLQLYIDLNVLLRVFLDEQVI
jgi:hypothetical protein